MTVKKLLVEMLIVVMLFTMILPISTVSAYEQNVTSNVILADFQDTFGTGASIEQAASGVKVATSSNVQRVTYTKQTTAAGMQIILNNVAAAVPAVDGQTSAIALNIGTTPGHFWGAGAAGLYIKIFTQRVAGATNTYLYIKKADDMDDTGDDIYLAPTEVTGLPDNAIPSQVTLKFEKIDTTYKIIINNATFTVPATAIENNINPDGTALVTLGGYSDVPGSETVSYTVNTIGIPQGGEIIETPKEDEIVGTPEDVVIGDKNVSLSTFEDTFGTGATVTNAVYGVKVSADANFKRVTYNQMSAVNGLTLKLADIAAPQTTADGQSGVIAFTLSTEAGHFWGPGAAGVHFRLVSANRNGTNGLYLYIKKADDTDDAGTDIYLPLTKLSGFTNGTFPANMEIKFKKQGSNYLIGINGVQASIPAACIENNISAQGTALVTLGGFGVGTSDGTVSYTVNYIGDPNAVTPPPVLNPVTPPVVSAPATGNNTSSSTVGEAAAPVIGVPNVSFNDMQDTFETGAVITKVNKGIMIESDANYKRATYNSSFQIDGLTFRLTDVIAPGTSKEGDSAVVAFTLSPEAGHYWGEGAAGVHVRLTSCNSQGTNGVYLYVKKADDTDDTGADIFLPMTKLQGFADGKLPKDIEISFKKVSDQYQISVNGIKTMVPAKCIDNNISELGTSLLMFGGYTVGTADKKISYVVNYIADATTQEGKNETAAMGNIVTAMVTATAAMDNNGKAMAVITREQLLDAISKANKEAANQDGGMATKVEIKVNAPADAKSIETAIPRPAVSLLSESKANELILFTPLACITFNDKAISTISSEATEDVKLTVSKVDTSTLSDEAKQKVDNRPVFKFSVISGKKTISQFNGKVTVTVPYVQKQGEDTGAIIIYYINANGKTEIVSNCTYSPEAEAVTFKSDHFSQYAVGYNKVTFKDVEEDAWYSKAVGFVAARGISEGTGNGKYSPEAKLTRAQFLVMMMRTYGIAPDKNPGENFTDAGNNYYTAYLAAAKRLGISAGVGNNMYAPNKIITRQEMFTMLYNALKLIGELPAGAAEKTITDFSDADLIASWAKDAMTLFVETGTIGGSGGKLSPTDTASRAQMAQVLYRLLSN